MIENQSQTQTISNTATSEGQQITIGITQQRETLPEPTVTTARPLSFVLSRCLLSFWISAVVTQCLSFLPWNTITKERLAVAGTASALIVAGVSSARSGASKAEDYVPSASYAASVLAGVLIVL